MTVEEVQLEPMSGDEKAKTGEKAAPSATEVEVEVGFTDLGG